METLIAIIAGLLINGIAWYAKKKNWTIKLDTLVLILAVALGVAYQTFVTVIPPAMQEQAVDFATKAMATSWVVWQFLIKRFITNEIPKTL